MNTSTFYTITWKLRPIDQIIPAGQRLGLVLTLSDSEFVSSHSTGATVISTGTEHFTASNKGRQVDYVITSLTNAVGSIGDFSLSGTALRH